MLYPISEVRNFITDHAEGVAVAREGTLYAGGEAGQVYRISPDGKKSEVLDQEQSIRLLSRTKD